jgi:cell division protein ZapA (FtsZ GTPase activity inhibitor)
MGKVTIEIDSVEAMYALNSISCYQRAVDKVARRDRVYYDRNASLEGLKDKLTKALKDQADIEDLREAMRIIDGE